MNSSERPAAAGSPPSTPAPSAVDVDIHTEHPADAASGADSVMPETPADGGAAQPGTIGHIGRYGLKQRLGEGGLGTVYAAYDPILSRTIAVKTLHLSAVDGDRAALDALFLNEARAAAGLNHPNIVTVYDAGLSEQGVYIAMERLRGRDLRQLLANGWRPDTLQAAQIVRRVADALSYAHSKGVIHCDIKPANIFMVGRTLPKVVDFGIARAAHGQAIPALEGVVAGSPHYLAPEQLRGETIDRRCDVYSLGVVMYELLAHRKAFAGQSLPEIVEAVERGNPVPVHELKPDVPLSLSRIVQQAMARDPAQRYRSARHLSRELREWIEHEGADLADDAPEAKPWLEPRRLGAVVTALIAMAGIGWWFHEALAPAPHGVSAEAPAAQSPAAGATPRAPGAAATVVAAAAAAAAAPAAQASAAAPTEASAESAKPAAPKPRLAPAAQRERAKPAAKAVAPAKPTAPEVAATGVVQLAISPWGRIEIDGSSAGITPPLAKLNLPAGDHVVTVRNEDFPPYTTRVKVNPNEPVTVRHRFGS
ncbi:MAG: serine/threonine-protein kinase [Burkholderiaceae bacterium]